VEKAESLGLTNDELYQVIQEVFEDGFDMSSSDGAFEKYLDKKIQMSIICWSAHRVGYVNLYS
jgi:hypothetical protein